jgi:hypothetical protein
LKGVEGSKGRLSSRGWHSGESGELKQPQKVIIANPCLKFAIVKTRLPDRQFSYEKNYQEIEL